MLKRTVLEIPLADDVTKGTDSSCGGSIFAAPLEVVLEHNVGPFFLTHVVTMAEKEKKRHFLHKQTFI